MPPLLGDGELKYDENSKKCGESSGENDEVLVGEANLWCWETRGSTYKKRYFSRGCATTIAVCTITIPLTHILRTAKWISNWGDAKSPTAHGWFQVVFQKGQGPGFPHPDSENI